MSLVEQLDTRSKKLAAEFGGTARVGKLNIDEHESTAARFGISSIPSVLLFKEGKVIETFVGVRPKERYAQALEQNLTTA